MTAPTLAKHITATGEIVSPFISHSVRSLGDYRAFLRLSETHINGRAEFERFLVPEDGGAFFVPGECAVCRRWTTSWVDFQYAHGPRLPNWRERLCCRFCSLNNRMRAALHFTNELLGGGGRLYLTEQCTPLVAALLARYPTAIGSEFFLDGTPPGGVNEGGLRFEDVTALSFADGEFDAVLTFDVLEHVPDYQKALGEFGRCLAPGGHLIITVPFELTNNSTVTRATVNADGSINHLLPPEMHGDPQNDYGILAYYNFGWDFLDDIRRAAFADVSAEFCWSRDLGYLGRWQFLISARK